ncbi:factor activating pos9 [Kalmusia sp. IMI 367209]|nr:factor activating pos9 [Kalmusia sp. IMI 367209]
MHIKRPESALLCSQCSPLSPLLVDISAASKSYKAHDEWWADTFGKVKLSIQGLSPNECELCRILHKTFSQASEFDAGTTVIKLSAHKFCTYKNLEYHTCSFEACRIHLILAPVLPVVTIEDEELVHAFAGRPVLQSFNPLLARIWVSKCHQQHPACRPVHSPKDFSFSFRVIDVQEGRLVDAPSNARFIALSYVWGGIKQVMLKKTNKMFLEQPGSITPEGLSEATGEYAHVKEEVDAEGRTIPQTIRDAIRLCQLMDERYLWTDSLCIMQDDEIQMDNGAWTNADKLAQIPNMNIIYGASALTIIAACGTDSNAGLPGVYASSTRTSQTVGKIGDQIFVSIQDDPMDTFWKSIWCSRAWTFQEFLLSKQHMIFLPNQVVFHCGTLAWCEDQPLEYIDDTMSHTFAVPAWTKSWQLNPLKLPDRSKWAEDIFFPGIFINQYYQNWLKNFLKRRLTVPSDILFAFDGALSASNRILGAFHHGLPINYFCETLNWGVGLRSSSYRVESPYQGLTQRRLGFPSWSWAGWIWDLPPIEEFTVYYGGKPASHWSRIGIWGTRISAAGNIELWKISSPDMEGWESLQMFPDSALRMDRSWIDNELPKHLETIKRSAIPSNCLIIKTVIATIFISSQPLNKYSNHFRVFPSADFSPTQSLGGIGFSSEWKDKINAGLQLQIIIVGRWFQGHDLKFPDQTDEDNPTIKCLVVQQVRDGIFERLNTFTAEASLMKRLDWTPIEAVLQ